jgi:hypothetical protein
LIHTSRGMGYSLRVDYPNGDDAGAAK